MTTTVPDGAATAAPKPQLTQELIHVFLDEIFERIGLLEGRLDDCERFQQAQDRRIAAHTDEVARLRSA